MNIYEILRHSKIVPDPSYYSGRGATLTDLNDKILESAHELILRHHGEDAAKAFVNMVGSIEVLSATNFIESSFRLQAMDWRWPKGKTVTGRGIHPGSIGSAFGTIMASMGPNRDETVAIGQAFLRRHGHSGYTKKYVCPYTGMWR